VLEAEAVASNKLRCNQPYFADFKVATEGLLRKNRCAVDPAMGQRTLHFVVLALFFALGSLLALCLLQEFLLLLFAFALQLLHVVWKPVEVDLVLVLALAGFLRLLVVHILQQLGKFAVLFHLRFLRVTGIAVFAGRFVLLVVACQPEAAVAANYGTSPFSALN